MKKTTLLVLSAFCSLVAHAGNLRKETNDYYIGSIDKKYEIKMVISFEFGGCSGSYYYIAHKKPIFLYGNCDQSKFDLQEQEKMLGYRKSSKGNEITVAIINGTMSGSWRSSDGKKTYSFEAKKITPDKKSVLQDSIGQYGIYHVSGFYGANTTSDIFYNHGEWSATNSSISGAMRSASDFSLSKNDQALLSSFKLSLDDSLNIKIYSEARIIADFPFTQESAFMVKGITEKDDKENNMGRIFQYNGIASFSENVVHIATTDKFDIASHLPLDVPTNGKYALSLDYNPVTMEFEMKIISAVCCDSTTLYLKKSN